jgi:hypothetical protein
MATLVSLSSLENKDSARPYLWPALDPHRKMGGDNPGGRPRARTGTSRSETAGTKGTSLSGGS